MSEISPKTLGRKFFPIFDRKTAKSDDLSNTASKTNANNNRKFICSSLSDDQMIIDAGQKKIGETCGTIFYTLGDPSDEKHHEKLKMPPWKTERVVGQFHAGYVICVKPGDQGSHWNKDKEVLSIVDKDLGFSEVGIRWPEYICILPTKSLIELAFQVMRKKCNAALKNLNQ